MDEMLLSNRKYVTTKRAARVTGYAQDYIGQLIRGGRLKATKVGKAWFVAEDEVLKLAGKQHALESPERALAVLENKKTVESSVSFSVEYPKTWAPIHYFRDDKPLEPISDKREVFDNKGSIEILDVHRVRIARQTVSNTTREPIRYASFDGVAFTPVVSGKPSSNVSVEMGHDLPGPASELLSIAESAVVTRLGHPDTDVRSPHLFNSVWFVKILVSAVFVSVLVFLIPIVG